MKELFYNFIDGFRLEEDRKNSIIKLLIIIVVGPLYVSVFSVIFLILVLYICTNILMTNTIDVLVSLYKSNKGKQRIPFFLFFGIILAPFLFILYLVVVVIRIVLYVLSTVYAILFFIMNIINKIEIANLLDQTIKNIQKKDIF